MQGATSELFEQVFRAMLPPMSDRPDTALALRLTLTERLLQLSGALLAAATPTQTLQAALDFALGAGAVWGRAEVIHPGGAASEVQSARPGAGALLGAEAQSELRAQALQHRQAHFGEVAGHPAAFLPFHSPQGAAGVIVLAFELGRRLSDEERHFFAALAAQCSLALDRSPGGGLDAQRLLDSSPIGVLVGDQTGHLLTANDRALIWLGANRCDLEVGTLNVLTLLAQAEASQPDTPSNAQVWAQVFEHGGTAVYEKTLRGTGAEALPLSVEFKRFGEGDRTLVAAYLQDLRSFKSAERVLRAQGAVLEEQVQRRTQELEVRNQALEAFELLSRELTLETDPYSGAARPGHRAAAVAGGRGHLLRTRGSGVAAQGADRRPA